MARLARLYIVDLLRTEHRYVAGYTEWEEDQFTDYVKSEIDSAMRRD